MARNPTGPALKSCDGGQGFVRRADPQKSGRIYYRPYSAGPRRVQLEPTLWVASPPLLARRIAPDR